MILIWRKFKRLLIYVTQQELGAETEEAKHAQGARRTQAGHRHNLARFRPQSVNTVINNSCAQRIGVQGVVGFVE
jgi:hypothetical protein